MNPGAIEEAGSTARGIIDALRGQPAVLALVVVNFAMLVFIFYALNSAAAFRERMFAQVIDNTNRIHNLMENRSVACPPPAPPLPLGELRIK
jgi:hypothetical protein